MVPEYYFFGGQPISACFISQLPRSVTDLQYRFTKTKLPLLNTLPTAGARPRAQSASSIFNKSRRKSGELNSTVTQVRGIINPGV